MKKVFLMLATLLCAFSASAVDYYLIGSDVNGKSWTLKSADAKFTETETAGVYEWTGTTLGTGFKINDGTWSNANANFGGSAKLTLGTPYTYTVGGSSGNITFANNLTTVNSPKVVLNTNNKTITVTGEGGGTVAWYIQGLNGNWDFIDSKKLVETVSGSKIYQLKNFTINSAPNGIAVATTGWGDKYGSSNSSTTISDDNLSIKLSKVDGEGGNVKFTLSGKYDIVWNLNTTTLTFKKVGAVELPNTLFLIGNVNNKDFLPNNGVELTKKSNGVFEGEVTLTGTLGTGFSYFTFVPALSTTGWAGITIRYGATSSDALVTPGTEMPILFGTENAWKLKDGTYTFHVDLNTKKMTATSKTAPVPAATFDFTTYDFLKLYWPAVPAFADWSGDVVNQNPYVYLPASISSEDITLSSVKEGSGFSWRFYYTKTSSELALDIYGQATETVTAPEGKLLKSVVLAYDGEYRLLDGIEITTEGAPAFVANETAKTLTWTAPEIVSTDSKVYNKIDFASPSGVKCLSRIQVELQDMPVGISDVELDQNAPAEYYTIQGIRVAEPTEGLYIKVQGSKAQKVLIRK